MLIYLSLMFQIKKLPAFPFCELIEFYRDKKDFSYFPQCVETVKKSFLVVRVHKKSRNFLISKIESF
jgi:hypothetical protein